MRQTTQPRFPGQGNKPSKPLTLKTFGGWGSRRNSQDHKRVCWRDPHSPQKYTKPPTQESAPQEPNLLVGSRGSDWKPGQKLSKCYCSLSDPSPTYSATTQQYGLPHLGKHLRLCPLLHNRHIQTKKYGPNKRTDQSSRKNTTKWWRDTQTITCRVQHTGN